MRYNNLPLAVALAALAFVPAVAQQAPGPDILVKGKQREHKVCKIFEAPTGSRVGETRICKTNAEWDEEERQAQDTVRQETLRQNALNAAVRSQNSLPGPPPR